jgi:transcriptional regulator with XRE-family HTH domain
VASTRINRYELGIHKADFPTSQRLADVLGIPVAYLYSDDEELAELILLFGQMTEEQRARLLTKLNRSLDPEG